MITLYDIEQYKKTKKLFSKLFKADEATIQKCADEIISLSIKNSGKIQSQHIVFFIEDNTTYLSKAFVNLKSHDEKLNLANDILSKITLLISSDGKAYKIKL
jgi:hypothetical protein